MAKPKGKQQSVKVAKATRQPRLKGSVKNRPDDYLGRLKDLSKHVTNFERSRLSELVESGTDRTIAKNIVVKESRKMVRDLSVSNTGAFKNKIRGL